MIGGCCGTTAAHIRAFSRLAEGAKPRDSRPAAGHVRLGIEALEISDEKRPVIVGERTNVIGSRQFRELVAAGKYEEASEIARRQVKSGAQIIDICLADPDRDELADMEDFLQHVIRKVKVAADDRLHRSQGDRAGAHLFPGKGDHQLHQPRRRAKSGFDKVVPLAKKYGAALVVGCIDER